MKTADTKCSVSREVNTLQPPSAPRVPGLALLPHFRTSTLSSSSSPLLSCGVSAAPRWLLRSLHGRHLGLPAQLGVPVLRCQVFIYDLRRTVGARGRNFRGLVLPFGCLGRVCRPFAPHASPCTPPPPLVPNTRFPELLSLARTPPQALTSSMLSTYCELDAWQVSISFPAMKYV